MSRWSLVYETFDSQAQGVREALCAVGNGYYCTRGAFEWAEADATNYPGTYLAGGYNRLQTEIAGRVIENEDLVNLPNWLCLRWRVAGGDWFNLMAVDVLSFRQELDLRQGQLSLALHVRDRAGRETRIESRRIAHMEDPHLGALYCAITPLNWSDSVEVRSSLDGRVINAGVKRYRDLNGTHLVPIHAGVFGGEAGGETLLLLITETVQSKLRVAQAARTRVRLDGGPPIPGATAADRDHVAQTVTVPLAAGQTLRVEKVVSLFNGKDVAIASPDLAAQEAVARAGNFDELLTTHVRAWRRLWDRCDIVVHDGSDVQMALRLHIFQLLQTLSPNSIDLDVGVPARGWHGEAYRGHVFWDELFILPFVDFRLPALSRAMLRYRYNRLPMARRMATATGQRGAMYPWQSGSDGREETQVMHLNPRSGRWLPDFSSRQRHVGLAVAYNVWQYYMATGERQFMALRGAEMLVEIARFFAGLAVPEGGGRFGIHGVMGPDEYHDAYPDAETPGLDNNAYTNVLVAWLMETVPAALAVLDDAQRHELRDRLGLDDAELADWDRIGRGMVVPFHDGDIISQFAGYEKLDEFDWDHYRAKYGDIQRLDRILEAEGDSTNRYKLSKQADVLMLFYLFSPARLAALFGRLGYRFDEAMWRRNIDYYIARTSHGSTLSYVVHSWVLARSQPEKAWELFAQALRADISDIQGGTTAEGIHLGAMAGTVDLVQRGFTGFEIREGALHFDPVLMDRLQTVRLRLRHLGHWLDVLLTGEDLTLTVGPGWTAAVPVCVDGQHRSMAPGETFCFRLGPNACG
ncbi:MAG: glycoside hydrolase family 65 protein [Rhodospirillales bacterium]|nr:glycoside hydrolase family 65 protein [Rhodospirillales bacterium]